MKKYTLLALLILLLTPTAWTVAQEAPPYMVLAVAGDIIVADLDGQPIRTLADGEAFHPIHTMTDVATYRAPVVSPDGQWVLFTEWFNDTLWRAPIDGSAAPAPLAENLAMFGIFGITFAPDGGKVGLTVMSEDYTDDGRVLMEFWAVGLADDSTEMLGTFPFGVGCGGGPLPPDSMMYELQAGFMGNTLLLEWLENGKLLTSLSCTGIGVQAIDLETGGITTVDEAMRRAKLSPDKNTLAGVVNESLHILDLASGTKSEYTHPTGGLDQLAWAGGDIIFTTVQERGSLALTPADMELASDVFMGYPPAEVALHETGIYRLDVTTMEAEFLWMSPDWRGIPILNTVDDTLFFSAVTSGEAMVQALNAGEPFVEVIELWPDSDLYRMELDGEGAPRRVVEGGDAPVFF